MRTLLVALVGVTGMVVAGCGGEADFTPLWLAGEGAAGVPVSGEPTGGANAWDGGSSAQPTGLGGNSGVGIPSGGASATDPIDAGSKPAPGQGGRPNVIGTGGVTAAGGRVGVAGSTGVGGGVAVGGSAAIGGTVAVGGSATVGGTAGVGGAVTVAGGGAVGGRISRGGSSPTGGSVAVGGHSNADGGVSAGGTGGTSSIVPPPGCELSGTPVSSSSYCQLSLNCSKGYVYTYCSVDYQGNWYCDCSSSYQYLSFAVTGAESAEACAGVSEICSYEDPLALMGEETCVGEEPAPQSTTCDLQCKRSAQLHGGVSVSMTTPSYASCSEQNGLQRCQCYNGTTSRLFDISDVGADSSCQVALDLCGSDQPIVFDGPGDCEVGYAYGYAGYCQMQQSCWQSAAVRDNVTALQYYARYSSCYDEQPSGTNCSCSGGQWSAALQLPGRLALDGACEDVQAICAQPEDIVLSGDLECVRSAQSSAPDYCSAQIVCTLPARWGDVDLIMNPGIWLTCQPDSSGAWLCTCSGDTQTVSLDVEAVQGWDACTEAAERCPDLIDVASLTGGIG